MSEDKRKYTRVHAVHLVSYTKLSAEEKVPEVMGMGNTIDVSEGGLKLTTKEPLKEGDVLQLAFTIGGEVIRADATVAHVEEVKHYRVGFSFGTEGLDRDDLAKIRDWLEKHEFFDRTTDAV